MRRTYLSIPKFNDWTVEVWEWIRIFFPLYIMDASPVHPVKSHSSALLHHVDIIYTHALLKHDCSIVLHAFVIGCYIRFRYRFLVFSGIHFLQVCSNSNCVCRYVFMTIFAAPCCLYAVVINHIWIYKMVERFMEFFKSVCIWNQWPFCSVVILAMRSLWGTALYGKKPASYHYNDVIMGTIAS